MISDLDHQIINLHVGGQSTLLGLSLYDLEIKNM
jgi:hypothetical protein